MTRKRHQWTFEQDQTLKDMVPAKDMKGRQVLADQFNMRHGTSLTSGQVHMRMLSVQGKLKRNKDKPKKVSRAGRKRGRSIHRYTPEQEQFIRDEYPKYRDRPRGMILFLKKFNNNFSTRLRRHAFGQKCVSLYKEDQKQKRHKKTVLLPALPAPASTATDTLGGVLLTLFLDGKPVWNTAVSDTPKTATLAIAETRVKVVKLL